MVARIKKNDSVIVISGKDRGKTGTVLEVLPRRGKVLVKGVAIKIRHVKARKQGETSAIKKEEGYLDESKVMPLCASCKLPARIRIKVLDDRSKARVCHQCEEIF